MDNNKLYPPSYKDAKKAHIPNKEIYTKKYDQSIKDPDFFWGEIAERLHWNKKWKIISDTDFSKAKINWFKGGELNASYNCIDRHIEAGDGNKTAIIWEGNNPKEDKSYTYSELLIKLSEKIAI